MQLTHPYWWPREDDNPSDTSLQDLSQPSYASGWENNHTSTSTQEDGAGTRNDDHHATGYHGQRGTSMRRTRWQQTTTMSCRGGIWTTRCPLWDPRVTRGWWRTRTTFDNDAVTGCWAVPRRGWSSCVCVVGFKGINPWIKNCIRVWHIMSFYFVKSVYLCFQWFWPLNKRISLSVFLAGSDFPHCQGHNTKI